MGLGQAEEAEVEAQGEKIESSFSACLPQGSGPAKIGHDCGYAGGTFLSPGGLRVTLAQTTPAFPAAFSRQSGPVVPTVGL